MSERPLRILHVIASLAPRYGGPAKVAELCAALAARGHQVHVVSTNIDGPGLLDAPVERPVSSAGFTSTVFRVRRPRSTACCPGIARWLHSHVSEFDVVHAHGLYLFPTLAACVSSRRQGIPYVFQPHGGLNRYHREHHHWRKRVYEALVETRNLRRAAAVRYDSVGEQREAVAVGFPAGVVIPPGSPIPAAPGAHPRSTGAVVFLGRLTQKKGLEILLEAFAGVSSSRPDRKLRIAGPDDEGIGRRLRELARERGIADRVQLDGLVLSNEKDNLLREAAVLVLPSADESFGAAVTEAMAWATPVVVTRGVPIHREIEGAGAGLVVERRAPDVARAIAAILDSPELAERLGRNGRRLVADRFSWPAVAGQVEDLYRSVAAIPATRLANRGSCAPFEAEVA